LLATEHLQYFLHNGGYRCAESHAHVRFVSPPTIVPIDSRTRLRFESGNGPSLV
jgi:hypothetical protein